MPTVTLYDLIYLFKDGVAVRVMHINTRTVRRDGC